MIFSNAQNYAQHFGANDLYIFAFGYEQRSYFLYDKLKEQHPSANQIIFAFDDYSNYSGISAKIKEAERKNIPIFIENYSNCTDVHTKIIETVAKHIEENDSVTVHIDYSSMPRSWYCKLPKLLEGIVRETDKIYFWYAEGQYPTSHEAYPSAGIESFSFFSGKPSLQIETNRIHVVALGYDAIRTQAILSISDPSYLVACYAYSPKREGFQENIKQVNDQILSRAAISLSLHIEDFEFMVSKLCDITNELLPAGDVILIPDGPKPLIFALSLVPDLVRKQGVTCLHISRNNDNYEAMDVVATGTIYGFSMKTNFL